MMSEFLPGKDNQRASREPSATGGRAKWWETAEEHRFALEVLQLRLRRQILKYIAAGTRSKEEIESEFDLSIFLAGYHLAMMEKALVIEQALDGYRATETGLLYLEKVEASD